MKKLLALLALLMLAASPASAAICSSLPYTFVNGSVIDATQMNTQFAALQTCINSVGANLTVGTFTVTGIGTFNGDILMTGGGEINIPYGVTASRSASPTIGMMRYNTTLAGYEVYQGASVGWQLLAPPPPPGGRITLASATPVMTSAVIGATTVYYTPYQSSLVPLWNGTTFSLATFSQLSQALSDTTLSPAAAVSGSCYDMFVWNNSGTIVVSRGPVWSSTSSRGYTLTRVNGVLVNPSSIANGPAGGYGTYVGTICTDSGGATVTFNPTPAAAAGGPTGGAWVGLWNYYNRITLSMQEQDSTVSWSYSGATARGTDNSSNNRVTMVLGVAEENVNVSLVLSVSPTSSAAGYICLELDATATCSGSTTSGANFGVSSGNSPLVSVGAASSTGLHFFQGLEITNGTSVTYYGGNYMLLSLTGRY